MEVLLKTFKKEIEDTFINVSPVINIDNDVKAVETFYPECLKIIQRDASFFDVERKIMEVDISYLWKCEMMPVDTVWKNMQLIFIGSFFHGDLKDKITPIISAVKAHFGMPGNENTEISKILDDQKSSDHLKEVLEYIMETRIAKIFMGIVEQIDIADLDLNFEKPEELLDIVKNPEHPIVKKIIEKIQTIIKSKIERGEITQSQLVTEVETIKAKITSIFGNMFNDALGGRGGNVSSEVLTGNSPEARRQRMLARLQKKQREKNSQ
jgi:hypothetical protein